MTANTAVTFPTTGTLLNETLTNANIYVGNGSNIATGVPVSKDVSMINTGEATVVGLNGSPIGTGGAGLLVGLISTNITNLAGGGPYIVVASEWFGIITAAPTGNTDLTSPTAADIVAAIDNPTVGLTIRTVVRNESTNRNISILGGAGVTQIPVIGPRISGNSTAGAIYYISLFTRLTNVGVGTEAAEIYPG